MSNFNCFLAYDVRGRIPDELNEDIVYRIGRAYAQHINPGKVVVGRDIRSSSQALCEVLAKGLTDSGVDVYDIGLCGTEEVYFATDHFGMDGGIMVTASHNPPDYNGLKFLREQSTPISGDTGLREIKSFAEQNEFPDAANRGVVQPLAADEAEMAEVVVESQRAAGAGVGMVGLETIRPSALARIPMPSVSADLAAYLQMMPGVVTTGDRGGHLFVRGGTPTQNLVLIDGIPVFQPFHIVGFYSAFPADIIAHADVHAGGFGARYGGRLSSVIDISTRNGNKKRVVGAASLAPFLGSVRIEVPLLPERVSLMASVRESVIERVSPDVLGQDLPYRFGDRFVKLHAFLSRTSSLSLTGLSTHDAGDVADTD